MRYGFLVGTLLVCCGCGGPAVTKVSGIITVADAPVPAGQITFVADDPANENASAQIGPDGRYELAISATTVGVKPGDYKVRVAAYKSLPDMAKRSEPAVHRKYFDPKTSNLKATVVAGPPQTIDFQLEGP